MKRMTCVLAAIAILGCSNQSLAQTGPATPKPGEKLKGRVAEALKNSKPILVKVTNPKDLSGAWIKRGEVKGVVKSVGDTCFQFEYVDGLGKVRRDCIPYGDAAPVKWHTRTLRSLREIGKWTAIIALAPVGVPVCALLLAILALTGHGFRC